MKIKALPLKNGLKDFANTVSTIPARLGDVAKASDTLPLPTDSFQVNKVARALHPKEQLLTVTKVEDVTDDFKRYYLKSENGRTAYFRAGQYISITLKIGESLCTRAYSLASSPKEALKNEYCIAVKRAAGGFVSDYILDNVKEGDTLASYAPEGTFVYEPLRDAKTVIGVAGGSGITPFLSLAKAIDERSENLNLILLYGARTEKDLAFKEELDSIAENNGSFKVVYVLSESKAKGFEHGFIGADLIKKYAPKGEYSVFACGPAAMYKFLKGEIEKLGLKKKYVRFEMQGTANGEAKSGETYKMTVINRGETSEFTCRGDETVLTALERAGVPVPVRCRSGECGFCRSKLVSGEVYIDESADYRRIADARFGYIHPCCSFPVSDITIKIN